MLCKDSIKALIEDYKNDSEVISMVYEALLSFESYHDAIYKMTLFMKLYDCHNMSTEQFQDELSELGRMRTVCHNAVISHIGIMNRLCQQNSIPPVYDGVVSEERPFRIEIADAVLAYVEDIVKNRQKQPLN